MLLCLPQAWLATFRTVTDLEPTAAELQPTQSKLSLNAVYTKVGFSGPGTFDSSYIQLEARLKGEGHLGALVAFRVQFRLCRTRTDSSRNYIKGAVEA